LYYYLVTCDYVHLPVDGVLDVARHGVLTAKALASRTLETRRPVDQVLGLGLESQVLGLGNQVLSLGLTSCPWLCH